MPPKKSKAPVTPRDKAKFDYAYLLYMQRVSQQDICERVGITAPTLQSWKESGAWDAKRAARTISLDDLLGKAMKKIDEMLDTPGLNADSFAKAVQQLKVLKKGNTVDDDINSLSAFSDFVIERRQSDPDITEPFIKLLTRLQDSYIQNRLK
jgi:hypothetical protein